MQKKQVKMFECPVCGKKSMKQFTSFTSNYPHGKNSRPLFRAKKVKYICGYYWFEVKDGKKEMKFCNTTRKFNLVQGDFDSIGGVTR